MKITTKNFSLAIGQLVDEGLNLPYGKLPGMQKNGKQQSINTAEDWESYIYNPPLYSVETEPDTEAGDKPSWTEIERALNRYDDIVVARERATHVARARAACMRFISQRVYGAVSIDEEMIMRANLSELSTKSARDKLKSFSSAKSAHKERLSQIVAQINGASLDDLLGATPYSDPSWWEGDQSEETN